MPKTAPKAATKPVAAKAPGKGDHVFLVDGSGYIFRAYHALPPMTRPPCTPPPAISAL